MRFYPNVFWYLFLWFVNNFSQCPITQSRPFFDWRPLIFFYKKTTVWTVAVRPYWGNETIYRLERRLRSSSKRRSSASIVLVVGVLARYGRRSHCSPEGLHLSVTSCFLPSFEKQERKRVGRLGWPNVASCSFATPPDSQCSSIKDAPRLGEVLPWPSSERLRTAPNGTAGRVTETELLGVEVSTGAGFPLLVILLLQPTNTATSEIKRAKRIFKTFLLCWSWAPGMEKEADQSS